VEAQKHPDRRFDEFRSSNADAKRSFNPSFERTKVAASLKRSVRDALHWATRSVGGPPPGTGIPVCFASALFPLGRLVLLGGFSLDEPDTLVSRAYFEFAEAFALPMVRECRRFTAQSWF